MQKNFKFEDRLWLYCLNTLMAIAVVGIIAWLPSSAHAWENNYQYQLEIQRQQTDFQNQQWALQQQQNMYMEQQRQRQEAQDALNQQFRQMGQRNY